MKIDDLDIRILVHMYGNDNCTTTDIANALFEEKADLNKNDNKVRFRLKKLKEHNVVLSTNTSPTFYNINKSQVLIGDAKTTIKNSGDKTFTIDMGKIIVIVSEDEKKYAAYCLD